MCGFTSTYDLGDWHRAILASGRYLVIERRNDPFSEQMRYDTKYFRIHDSVNDRTAITRMKGRGWVVTACVKVKLHDRVQPASGHLHDELRRINAFYEHVTDRADMERRIGRNSREDS